MSLIAPEVITAVAVEGRKAASSPVLLTTGVLLVAGVGVLAGVMTAAARGGNEQIRAQLAGLGDADPWPQLIGGASQITAAAGFLAFGVALSWLIGREFTDRTVAGLFALPISRTHIALGKLAVFAGATFPVALLLTAVVFLVGLVSGLGAPDPAAWNGLARLFILTVLTGFLVWPAAWVATLGRGLLPGIAATVVLIVIAQVFAVMGTGAWFPIVAPALWAVAPEQVSARQLTLVALVPALSAALTVRAWSRLQLDR
ncbi:ABC transporter permease [Ornithinimicrobium pratense]|uniref:ABC transporter permease subunit n=1 Tax=Ornithinimicrobium pratense TaxID=2593973 RepID=A0A5J6V2H3_9MICO|nr:ABC transporter permease [Ornithinimicrobium pratense]QFG67915.1 ABC transporter permease subunit [Ornithinimicrobium pratense]